jgi:hypothetical protein
MACVYALYENSNPDKIRYIGRTRNNDAAQRLKTHIKAARSKKTNYHIHNWINSVLADNGSIGYTVLESGLSYEESGIREIHYIELYNKLGITLTNMTVGGEGIVREVYPTRTEEHKKKISIALKNHKRSKDHAASISKALTGKKRTPHTEETKKKMSLAQKGKKRGPLSEEHRKKLSDVRKKQKIKQKV